MPEPEPEPEQAPPFCFADVKLCGFDLDGTLCRGDNTVSARTKAAVAAVRAEGVQIVLATGRTAGMAASIPQLVDGAVDFVVTSNGAETMTSRGGWTRKVSYVIPPADLRAAVLALREGISEDVDLLLMMAGLEGAAGAICMAKAGHAKMHLDYGAEGANRFTVLPHGAKRFFSPPSGPREGEALVVERDVLEWEGAAQYQAEGAGVFAGVGGDVSLTGGGVEGATARDATLCPAKGSGEEGVGGGGEGGVGGATCESGGEAGGEEAPDFDVEDGVVVKDDEVRAFARGIGLVSGRLTLDACSAKGGDGGAVKGGGD